MRPGGAGGSVNTSYALRPCGTRGSRGTGSSRGPGGAGCSRCALNALQALRTLRPCWTYGSLNSLQALRTLGTGGSRGARRTRRTSAGACGTGGTDGTRRPDGTRATATVVWRARIRTARILSARSVALIATASETAAIEKTEHGFMTPVNKLAYVPTPFYS